MRTGLNQLERALQDIADIKQCCGDMEGALGGVAACWEACREVSHIAFCMWHFGPLTVTLTERTEQAKRSYSKLASLLVALKVREENLRHSQLATARENLKHIFTVPETVSRTEGWVEEGKLLQVVYCPRLSTLTLSVLYRRTRA